MMKYYEQQEKTNGQMRRKPASTRLADATKKDAMGKKNNNGRKEGIYMWREVTKTLTKLEREGQFR
jgi:hypothetical protein